VIDLLRHFREEVEIPLWALYLIMFGFFVFGVFVAKTS
jgi:hypothetical protein